MKRTWPSVTAVLVAGFVLGGMVTGCRDDEKKIKSIRGTTRSVNPETRAVSMDFVKKDGSKLVLDGKLLEDTKIFINGRPAKMEDVRIDEDVDVKFYTAGKGPMKEFVITEVRIQREETVRLKPASQPATATTQTATEK